MTHFENAAEKLEFGKIRQRVLRYAMSDAGREVLQSAPVLTDPDAIHTALGQVTAMKRLLEVEEDLPLEGIHSVRSAIQKAGVEGSILTSRELAHIGGTLHAARNIRTALHKRRDAHPDVWRIAEDLPTDKVLEFNIDQAIDDTGAVRASASRELQSIRRSIADHYEDLRNRLEGILRTVSGLGYSQDEIITTREGRMVLPVKVEHKKHVPGFIHSASASGATVFIEPTETLELNNDIRSLQFQEQREIERILRDLTIAVGEQRPALLQMVDMLAALDALQARAKYSIEVLGVEPRIVGEGDLHLREARHPLLLAHHGRKDTVPLDLDIGESFTTLIISGPNAGGKSVMLKCIGVLALMTQSGLHIPAREDATMRVFRSIFVDIGDEQSIESDLSTFSSHLANLKTIVQGADRHSLVLIDEIGTGTDPAEGGAIAAAVLERLTAQRAVTIATTHHGALKVFAHETDGVENGAMEFNPENLSPTYRFRAGVPGSSYALDMANRLGFPGELMDRARSLLGGEHMRLDALLQELEASAQDHRATTEQLHVARTRAEQLAREYEAKMQAVAQETREIKRKAADEARAIVERANAVIEQSVREIREHEADKNVVRSAREDVSRLRASVEETVKALEPEPVEDAAQAHALRAGSTVTLGDKTETGEIVALSADGKSATVVFGIVKMRVPVAELRATRKRAAPRPSGRPVVPDHQDQVPRELDLRGMTGDEAIPLIDKFIDDAILAGLHRIDIIHGKGTGALRRKVTDFLSTHPRVRSFRLGEWNEGGVGATVCDLSES
jgi:DNA mismatch repair protein MutS2